MSKKLIDQVVEEALKDEEKIANTDETLEEAGMIRVTRQAKMARLSGGLAMQMAKKANDPMAAKAMKYKKLFLDMKKKIMMKYGMKGKAAARKAVTK